MRKALYGALAASLSMFAAGAADAGFIGDGGGTSIDVEDVTPTTFKRQGTEIRVYSAKLICGLPRDGVILAPGFYLTAINVHNPDPDNAVTFTKKVVEALPERFVEEGDVGKVSDRVEETLGPDEAFEVDCQDALLLLGEDENGDNGDKNGDNEVPRITQDGRTFLKGFVVIETRGRPNAQPLDVVGVYTVSGFPFGANEAE